MKRLIASVLAAGALVAGGVAAAPAASASTWNPGYGYVTYNSNTYVKMRGDGGKIVYVNPGHASPLHDTDAFYVPKSDVKYYLWGVRMGAGWHSIPDAFNARVSAKF